MLPEYLDPAQPASMSAPYPQSTPTQRSAAILPSPTATSSSAEDAVSPTDSSIGSVRPPRMSEGPPGFDTLEDDGSDIYPETETPL